MGSVDEIQHAQWCNLITGFSSSAEVFDLFICSIIIFRSVDICLS